MVAIRNENEDASLCCCVNRKPIWYDFHTVMKSIRSNLNMTTIVAVA